MLISADCTLPKPKTQDIKMKKSRIIKNLRALSNAFFFEKAVNNPYNCHRHKWYLC